MLANFEVTENKLYKDEAGKFQVTRGSGGLSVFMVSVKIAPASSGTMLTP
jgi:hypothetical protein